MHHSKLYLGRGCICIKFTSTLKLLSDANNNQYDAFKYNNYGQNPYCNVVVTSEEKNIKEQY